MRRFARVLAVGIALSTPSLATTQSGLPTPESAFGFRAGADYKLATYDQSLAYFRQLDAASDRLTLVEVGRTSQGRPMVFALISSPENLANVDRYRSMNVRLAHPGDLTESAARQIARDGKAFVHLDGGLHSTEVAGAQQTPQLAYDLLARADEPLIKSILDNVVVMLWPTINPDGQQMVAEWYMSNVGTPYELSGLPRLYQEYVGHDNNRDAYMLNMIESRVIEHAWRQWEPHIVYVQHQSGPFPTRIWLPPFSEPVGRHAPYLMSREVNMIGMGIAKALEEQGQPGATHMGTAFDAWYPGYIDYAPIFKNVPAFWTETALFQYATPHEYTIDDFPAAMRDLRPQSLYSSPWRPGWWRLRDAVEYMETASLATLEFAAKYKESLLFDRYLAGRGQIAKGRKEAPYAYFVPQEQRDPVAAVELLRRLAFGGVRIDQLTAPVTSGDRTYPAGTWVIPTDQEFAAVAREVLDVQTYPDLRQYPGGPPERPYDAAGWTLPLQMGVTIGVASAPLTDEDRARMKRLGAAPDPSASPTPYPAAPTDAAPFDSVPGAGFDPSAAAAAIVPPPGRISGTGAALAVDPAQNNAFRAINRAWKQNATVSFVPAAGTAGASYVIAGLSPAAQTQLATVLAISARRVPPRTGTPLKKPRIGLFQPWSGSMDEGWMRWLLERYDFEFTTLRPADFHSPLHDRVDVVILAEDARLPIEGAAGRGGGGGGGRGGAGGGRAVRPEYAYQLSPEDLAGFEQFVRAGGAVVCLGNASNTIIQQFKLPVRNVVAGLRPEEFFLRGSIVEVAIDPSHPVMAGMPAKAAVFVDSSPVFETLDGFKGAVLARYQESGSPLRSGYLIGEKHVNGKAAAVDVQLDAGHIVLLGFRPQWRGQPFGTFRVVFNAALSHGVTVKPEPSASR
jgi:zinc carboxypeptidase